MICVGPPMGRASTAGKEALLEQSDRSKGSWELRSLCSGCQLVENRDQTNTTLRPQIPRVDMLRGPK